MFERSIWPAQCINDVGAFCPHVHTFSYRRTLLVQRCIITRRTDERANASVHSFAHRHTHTHTYTYIALKHTYTYVCVSNMCGLVPGNTHQQFARSCTECCSAHHRICNLITASAFVRGCVSSRVNVCLPSARISVTL